MFDKRLLIVLIEILIIPAVVFAQSDKLLPMEKFILGQVENQIYPRNERTGVLDERQETNSVLMKLISIGPNIDYCDGEMMNILLKKYNLLPLNSNQEYNHYLSKIKEGEGEYNGRFIAENSDYKIEGTIYLTKKGDKWLLYDFEAEYQEISNP